MYEDQTYDIILERMMNRVSDKIDKRPSSPVYDLHSSTAIEFQILYIELEYLIKNSYGDTAAREFLILLAKDRGLSPEPATKAILQGEFTPTNIDVTGKRFNIGEINYVVTEQITPGTYKVQCETEGVVGNQYLGDMIPMEYIDGLQTASLTSVLIPGEDEEDTEVFRQRYFDSFNEQSFGGNHADYMAKVKSIEGEYDPSTSFRAFTFWVNDASVINTGVYIQGTLSTKLENLSTGSDITSKLGLLMEYNSGDEYITDSDFRSGNLVVQNIDTSKKVLTLEFKNLKYTNNLKKEVVLNGTLTIPYKILE